MEYKRLGDYIREVNVRNRELKVTKLVGLTIDKAFIPSVANVIGTDLSNYKVIRREQFACSLMQVSRDGKIPVAMFEEDEAIMSPAYPMFEVVDKTVLLPQYLMMWFSRSEFDREASYYAVGGVRGSLTWEDFCSMKIPVPDIARQREIVSEYETLTNRIRLNEQMIAKLEATAQALYRKMFVDGVDKENLPEGWRKTELSTLVDIKRGSSPRPIDQYMAIEGLPWLKISDATNAKSPFIFEVKEFIKEAGLSNTVYRHAGDLILSNSASPGLPKFLEIDCCIHDGWLYFENTKIPLIFLYHTFQDIRKDLVAEGNGAIFINLKTEILKKWKIVLPDKETLESFCGSADTLFLLMKTTALENQKLLQLQSLLLARMGK